MWGASRRLLLIEQALKDVEAMPPPPMVYPWPRVASKDIARTLTEEMPVLEDVTSDPTYAISQDVLEEADKNARRLDELELILGIHPGFDTSAPLDPILFDDILNKCQEFFFQDLNDRWVCSYQGLLEGFRKNELFQRIVLRAGRDTRAIKLFGPSMKPEVQSELKSELSASRSHTGSSGRGHQSEPPHR